MEPKIYHHVLHININNRVISHNIEESKDQIKPESEEAYEVTYNRTNQVFRVSLYTYDRSMFTVKDYVLKTFRSYCKQPSENSIFA